MIRLRTDRRRRGILLGGILVATTVVCARHFAVPDRSPEIPALEEGQVWSLKLRLSPAAVDSLRHDPRRDVPATVELGGHRWTSVEVHLKGSTGSFRPIDDRPSLTLDFRGSPQGPIVAGTPKIHLNNSVEDPGLLNELLGSHLARSLGIPAPRVAHARILLNDRPLGLYVLKEGFTDALLARFSDRPGPFQEAAIAEPRKGGDIDAPLKSRSRRLPAFGREGLPELTAACRESDPESRWRKLQTQLDAQAFATFMAFEIFLGHRDGYCVARNNYRIASNQAPGRAFFLPHGMDQLLGNPDFPWNPQMAGLVARAFLNLPQGRALYRQRLEELLTTAFRPEPLAAWLDDVVAALRSSLSSSETRRITRHAEILKERLRLRARSLGAQLREVPERPRPSFEDGLACLGPWSPRDAFSAQHLEATRDSNGHRLLEIQADTATTASWRARIVLEPGHYRWEGRARTSRVHPLPFGSAQGAGLRVGGSPRAASPLLGTQDWTLLAVEFGVDERRQATELICELRASAGAAWFDADSLRLTRLP